MVQITFTASLIAAVVACAYFADATPVASFEKGLDFEGEGYVKEETRPFQNVYEFKPLEYEPYGNKYYDQKYYNHGDFQNKQHGDLHKPHHGEQHHKPHHGDFHHKPHHFDETHKFYKDGGSKKFEGKEFEHDFEEKKFEKKKDHDEEDETHKYYENKYHSDKYHKHRDEDDIKREKEFKEVEKKNKDHKHIEGYGSDFDKSAYELGYGEFPPTHTHI